MRGCNINDAIKKMFKCFVYFVFSGRGRVANSQIKVTKMLLIVSTVFVCLNLPSYAVRVKIFLGVS